VPEGLPPSEVGKEIAEHRARAAEKGPAAEHTGRDRLITIVEATLLAVVAVLAAWSGFAAAKWGTESSLELAQASAARTQANRAAYQAADLRNFDSSTFTAWFVAYVAGNKDAMRVAEYRFRPEFRGAFDAWLRTHPFTNTNAPAGPTYMREYRQPEEAGGNSDGYVRTTVYLATVLFLVGISGHFRVRGARIGLIGVGAVILVFASVLLIIAPKPPV
jgi:hypothetical protein